MRVAVIGHTYIVDANRGKLRFLAPRGHHVLLLTPREWLEKDFGLRRFEPPSDLDFAAFDCAGHGHVRRYRYPCGDLLHATRGWRPDAILAETEPGGLAALQAAWLATRVGAPLLPFAWENLPLAGAARALARPVYCAARRLLAGSAGAAAVARRAGCARPITVIPQVGVDPAAVPPRAPRRGGPAALFVGRLDRKKGADLLLDALALAPAWRATLVGDGGERAALTAQAARLGLAERVVFAGAVPHSAIPGFFAGADAFVLPSRSVPGWTEQFGHVLAWAMAAGTPIVGSTCGAIPEVAGDAGLIVPENDAPALAEALRRLAHGALAQTLGGRGRARAAALYTDEAVARRLERALVMAVERDDADVLV
jgi:glycosyltransferase involved in cell wall biosynthesis